MFHPLFTIHSFALSDVGCVRAKNEDAYFVSPEMGYFILADGMGGANAGEIASNACVEELSVLLKSLRQSPMLSEAEMSERLKDACCTVNAHIYEQGQTHSQLKGMGTTVCLACVHMNQMLIAHVGDSRVYRLCRTNSNFRLQQLTSDHSLVNELLEMGEIASEETQSFPYRHILTRAIGTESVVEPTLHTSVIEPNDFFLLCSDGLTNFVTDDQIQDMLQKAALSGSPYSVKVENVAFSLVALAKKNGGGDNITVIIIGFEP